MPKAKPNELDTSEYSFAKFAATYFNSTATGQYSKRPLKKSLLDHDLPTDEIAAQAVWVMILRFMGDMAEAKYDEDEFQSGSNNFGTMKTSVMQRLTRSLSRSAVQSKEFQEALLSMGETDHQRLIRKTLKRKTKLPQVLRNALDNPDEMAYYQEVLNTRSSNLDKLHFIIGHGILRPNLRDEILSQICKQLTNNPYRTSFAKGWILLSLCIGCFPPSKRFENYLRCFIRNGPELYAPYCEQRLDRTLKNGPRTQPPSWLELQATRNKAPITLQICLMDGSIKKLQVDSASTANEAVQQLAQHIGLVDSFGFSIVISLFDKILSLGSGREHILDAISNCEQYAKEQGQNERKAPWKLYLRKEMFTTWYDPAQDQYATHLIYKQITRGLNYGEYRCRTERDIAMICALEYYAEVGPTLDTVVLRKLIPDFVPKDLLSTGEKALQTWEQLIRDVFLNNQYVRTNAPQQRAKEDICLYAQISWPMLFSRYFEAVRTAGPKLVTDNVVIAVNSCGVYYIDETEQVLAELSYAEISAVYAVSGEQTNVDELHIDTVQKEDFTFKCYEAQDVTELINYMIKNLKMRSKYAIATRAYYKNDDENETNEIEEQRLHFQRGDLIQFDVGVSGAQILEGQAQWARGICNGNCGEFPVATVTVLATLSKPTPKILQIYRDSSQQFARPKYNRYNTIQRERMHTLRKFASEHFRDLLLAGSSTQTHMHTLKSKHEELWRHSRELLKAPLLRQLQQQLENFDLAVNMYHQILKYMGDIPRGKLAVNTDLIFAPAMQNEGLRDELYCQLMKQLTDNRVHYSEERGWDLMYLATGVMYPSSAVMKELLEFLRTRPHVLAAESLKRVKRTLLNGQRKHPPYIIEVEGIQQRCMHIYHKIYFPDETDEAFEIESFTRASDLAKDIVQRLCLKSGEGFNLFVRIGDKAFSVPEHEFIFDFINELMQWLKHNMPTRATDTQINCHYQLYFMKKLWLSTVIPGKDPNADIIFYYPQELPKYLSGYYKVDKDLALKMAALIYLAEFGNNWTHMQHIQDTLPQLVSEDVIPLLRVHEWKSQITSALKKLMDSNLTEEQAKQEILTYLSEQKMFGSTFFVVEQNNEPSLPNTLLIAINRSGLHIIDPNSKDLLQSYDYNELSFWSSGNTYFHIRFGNMIGASKLLCSTSQGYKMDDLLSSYIKFISEKQ